MRRAFVILSAVLAFMGTAHAAGKVQVGAEALLPEGPGAGVRGTPDTAFGGGVYLVVWREGWHGEGGEARIYAARVGESGKVIDAKPIVLTPEGKDVQERPRVAFGGGVFLVVWQELVDGKHYDVRAVRVSPKGKVLDAKPISVASGPQSQAMPDVASDGKNFAVVWQGALVEGGDTTFHIFAASVSAAGVPGKASQIVTGSKPIIAWNGQNYLVVAAQTIIGVRLGAAAEPADKRKRLYIVPSAGVRENTRAIAGAGSNWLVIADRSLPDYWGWAGPGAMRAYLVDSAGVLNAENKAAHSKDKAGNHGKLPHWLDLGVKKNDGAPWPSGEAACAWDGTQFVAVWQRFHIEKAVMFKNCDIVLSRLDGFKPLDRDGVGVATSEVDERRPALATDGAGSLLCVYEKYEAGGKVRIGTRVLKTR